MIHPLFKGEVMVCFVRFLSLFVSVYFVLHFSSCTQNKIEYSNSPNHFDSIIEQADFKIGKGEVKEGLRLVDSAIRSQKEPSVIDRFKYYKFYCGYYYRSGTQYDQAKLYTDSMFLLLSENKTANRSGYLAEANYSMGDILFSQKKYDEAYKYFYSAKMSAKNSSDPCNLSDYSYRMGMILYKQSRYKSAAGYFIQSYNEIKNCRFDFPAYYRKQELLNNAALCYTKLGVSDSALYYYNHALKLIESNRKKFPDKEVLSEVARAVVYGNQGQIFWLKGDKQTAEKLFIKSIEINKQPRRDNRDGLLIRLHLAGLYLEEKRMVDLKQQIELIRASLKILPNPEAELKFLELLWKYDQLLGENGKAFEDLLAYTRLKDSIQQSSSELTEADVSEQLDNLEKQYEINFLKKDKEISDIYFTIVVVLAIMSVAIILLILNNWRRSRTNILKLTSLHRQVMDQKIKLENTLSQLELQSQEKDRILRAVAHDLRNPVGGVASVSGLLLEEEGVTPEQEEMLKLIQNTCLDTLQLINEILEITLDDKLVEFPMEQVDINIVLTNTIDLLRFKAIEKNQQILLHVLPDPTFVTINRERIGRVISNLVINAIKFSPVGGKIRVEVKQMHSSICICVIDNGIGIPDEIKPRVFDTFTEAKRPGTSGEKPFGLGLSISRQIIEAHRGKIWFESEEGNGTRFCIELKTY